MTTLPLSPHKREVLRAWLDSRLIQVKTDYGWCDIFSGGNTPSLAGKDESFRIKPTPARRFWNDGEIPIGWQIRLINDKDHYGLIQYGVDGVVYLTTSRIIDNDNFMHYEVAPPGPANAVQWQPAGVEE